MLTKKWTANLNKVITVVLDTVFINLIKEVITMENFQQPTINNERKKDTMTQERIKQIEKDIKNYAEAIADAQGALAEAERELEEVLNEAYSE